jgi:hypothetical protein
VTESSSYYKMFESSVHSVETEDEIFDFEYSWIDKRWKCIMYFKFNEGTLSRIGGSQDASNSGAWVPND